MHRLSSLGPCLTKGGARPPWRRRARGVRSRGFPRFPWDCYLWGDKSYLPCFAIFPLSLANLPCRALYFSANLPCCAIFPLFDYQLTLLSPYFFFLCTYPAVPLSRFSITADPAVPLFRFSITTYPAVILFFFFFSSHLPCFTLVPIFHYHSRSTLL